jgi:hypothetical protein
MTQEEAKLQHEHERWKPAFEAHDAAVAERDAEKRLFRTEDDYHVHRRMLFDRVQRAGVLSFRRRRLQTIAELGFHVDGHRADDLQAAGEEAHDPTVQRAQEHRRLLEAREEEQYLSATESPVEHRRLGEGLVLPGLFASVDLDAPAAGSLGARRLAASRSPTRARTRTPSRTPSPYKFVRTSAVGSNSKLIYLAKDNSGDVMSITGGFTWSPPVGGLNFCKNSKLSGDALKVECKCKGCKAGMNAALRFLAKMDWFTLEFMQLELYFNPFLELKLNFAVTSSATIAMASLPIMNPITLVTLTVPIGPITMWIPLKLGINFDYSFKATAKLAMSVPFKVSAPITVGGRYEYGRGITPFYDMRIVREFELPSWELSGTLAFKPAVKVALIASVFNIWDFQLAVGPYVKAALTTGTTTSKCYSADKPVPQALLNYFGSRAKALQFLTIAADLYWGIGADFTIKNPKPIVIGPLFGMSGEIDISVPGLPKTWDWDVVADQSIVIPGFLPGCMVNLQFGFITGGTPWWTLRRLQEAAQQIKAEGRSLEGDAPVIDVASLPASFTNMMTDDLALFTEAMADYFPTIKNDGVIPFLPTSLPATASDADKALFGLLGSLGLGDTSANKVLQKAAVDVSIIECTTPGACYYETAEWSDKCDAACGVSGQRRMVNCRATVSGGLLPLLYCSSSPTAGLEAAKADGEAETVDYVPFEYRSCPFRPCGSLPMSWTVAATGAEESLVLHSSSSEGVYIPAFDKFARFQCPSLLETDGLLVLCPTSDLADDACEKFGVANGAHKHAATIRGIAMILNTAANDCYTRDSFATVADSESVLRSVLVSASSKLNPLAGASSLPAGIVPPALLTAVERIGFEFGSAFLVHAPRSSDANSEHVTVIDFAVVTARDNGATVVDASDIFVAHGDSESVVTASVSGDQPVSVPCELYQDATGTSAVARLTPAFQFLSGPATRTVCFRFEVTSAQVSAAQFLKVGLVDSTRTMSAATFMEVRAFERNNLVRVPAADVSAPANTVSYFRAQLGGVDTPVLCDNSDVRSVPAGLGLLVVAKEEEQVPGSLVIFAKLRARRVGVHTSVETPAFSDLASNDTSASVDVCWSGLTASGSCRPGAFASFFLPYGVDSDLDFSSTMAASVRVANAAMEPAALTMLRMPIYRVVPFKPISFNVRGVQMVMGVVRVPMSATGMKVSAVLTGTGVSSCPFSLSVAPGENDVRFAWTAVATESTDTSATELDASIFVRSFVPEWTDVFTVVLQTRAGCTVDPAYVPLVAKMSVEIFEDLPHSTAVERAVDPLNPVAYIATTMPGQMNGQDTNEMFIRVKAKAGSSRPVEAVIGEETYLIRAGGASQVFRLPSTGEFSLRVSQKESAADEEPMIQGLPAVNVARQLRAAAATSALERMQAVRRLSLSAASRNQMLSSRRRRMQATETGAVAIDGSLIARVFVPGRGLWAPWNAVECNAVLPVDALPADVRETLGFASCGMMPASAGVASEDGTRASLTVDIPAGSAVAITLVPIMGALADFSGSFASYDETTGLRLSADASTLVVENCNHTDSTFYLTASVLSTIKTLVPLTELPAAFALEAIGPAACGLPYVWRASSWDKCGVDCGSVTQTRKVWCEETASGLPVDSSFCDSLSSAPRPESSHVCENGPCVNIVTAWGDCSAACGDGFQYRATECRNQNGNGALVGSWRCAALAADVELSRPCVFTESEEKAIRPVCATGYEWATGLWSACETRSGACASGARGRRTRSVRCVRTSDKTTVPDFFCQQNAVGIRPDSSKSCSGIKESFVGFTESSVSDNTASLMRSSSSHSVVQIEAFSVVTVPATEAGPASIGFPMGPADERFARIETPTSAHSGKKGMCITATARFRQVATADCSTPAAITTSLRSCMQEARACVSAATGDFDDMAAVDNGLRADAGVLRSCFDNSYKCMMQVPIGSFGDTYHMAACKILRGFIMSYAGSVDLGLPDLSTGLDAEALPAPVKQEDNAFPDFALRAKVVNSNAETTSALRAWTDPASEEDALATGIRVKQDENFPSSTAQSTWMTIASRGQAVLSLFPRSSASGLRALPILTSASDILLSVASPVATNFTFSNIVVETSWVDADKEVQAAGTLVEAIQRSGGVIPASLLAKGGLTVKIVLGCDKFRLPGPGADMPVNAILGMAAVGQELESSFGWNRYALPTLIAGPAFLRTSVGGSVDQMITVVLPPLPLYQPTTDENIRFVIPGAFTASGFDIEVPQLAFSVSAAKHDCRVGAWSEWSSCKSGQSMLDSKALEEYCASRSRDRRMGVQVRNRTVVQEPTTSGASCPSLMESRNCDVCKPCAAVRCYNGGQCVRGECVCATGFSGSTCSLPAPPVRVPTVAPMPSAAPGGDTTLVDPQPPQTFGVGMWAVSAWTSCLPSDGKVPAVSTRAAKCVVFGTGEALASRTCMAGAPIPALSQTCPASVTAGIKFTMRYRSQDAAPVESGVLEAVNAMSDATFADLSAGVVDALSRAVAEDAKAIFDSSSQLRVLGASLQRDGSVLLSIEVASPSEAQAWIAAQAVLAATSMSSGLISTLGTSAVDPETRVILVTMASSSTGATTVIAVKDVAACAAGKCPSADSQSTRGSLFIGLSIVGGVAALVAVAIAGRAIQSARARRIAAAAKGGKAVADNTVIVSNAASAVPSASAPAALFAFTSNPLRNFEVPADAPKA